ncbi:hypothetical protein EDD17DRAFT_1800119 [Pisolithus thermaeus]|nr:hypothetical protein EDD17DRAFT_1800119 [Pisolithus thermaeus]
MTTRLRVGIPPEVWDHIFEIATHVPYTLVPEIFEKSTLIGDDYNELCCPALKTAFATKRSLVLVCKQWWHLAIRYLYRTILIDNPRKILSICSTLQNYANGALQSPPLEDLLGINFLGIPTCHWHRQGLEISQELTCQGWESPFAPSPYRVPGVPKGLSPPTLTI